MSKDIKKSKIHTKKNKCKLNVKLSPLKYQYEVKYNIQSI